MCTEKWKNASKEEKAYWQAKAEEEAVAHKEKYPGKSIHTPPVSLFWLAFVTEANPRKFSLFL